MHSHKYGVLGESQLSLDKTLHLACTRSCVLFHSLHSIASDVLARVNKNGALQRASYEARYVLAASYSPVLTRLYVEYPQRIIDFEIGRSLRSVRSPIQILERRLGSSESKRT